MQSGPLPAWGGAAPGGDYVSLSFVNGIIPNVHISTSFDNLPHDYQQQEEELNGGGGAGGRGRGG